MGTGTIILSIIYAAVCLAICAIVLLQSGRAAGISGAISGAGETYWGKNKARSLEGRFEKSTEILAALYIILALVLFFLIK